MATRFKLRCSVLGHKKDVRAVVPAVYPDGGFISGSRDITARVWVPNEHDVGFQEAHVMGGHNNFVSCVCLMPPNEQYPHGIILTGSNDHTILAYTLDSPSPIYKLEGHTNSVCSLAAGKFGTLISGSWDETAKVWLNQKCLMTLKGHTAAVWTVAILPEGGFMLTGSADKTIKMWKAGKCEMTFTGHTDCVRGLAVISPTEFLSCSNDASIRRWLTVTGECIHTYYGHTNYVYDIALMPNGLDFVTTGEDRTLRVWRDGECEQVIAHPTQSVWCVCVLGNGDIITGSSDSVIRVFSSEASRQAAPDQLKAFEDEVATSAIPSQIGDIPKDQVAGPEALTIPGTKDGQPLMVKDGSSVHMYQWSAGETRWVKIGDVVGSSGSTPETSGKQLYKGKEYDYVFDVELQEGSPPLKLPYNLSEDPWMAAHNFLEDNEISQLFLDQVAKFIMDQTKGLNLETRAAPEVSDPLTGSGRYIPGGSAGGTGQTSGSVDPFTGGGRYVPTYGEQSSGGQQQYGSDPLTGAGSYKPAGAQNGHVTTNQASNQYFPKTGFQGFDQAKPEAILGKLREFNNQADPQNQITEEQVVSLGSLMTGIPPEESQLPQLSRLLQWPAGVLFPVLDILRLAIRHPAINTHFCNDKDGPMFINYLLTSLSQGAPEANQMLVLRTLANTFYTDPGKRLLLDKRDSIITGLMKCKDNSNRNVQTALSTVLLNYAVSFHGSNDIEAKSQCLSAGVTIADTQRDPEANFRLLVCFGTLVTGDKHSTDLAKALGVQQFINKCKALAQPSKVPECARMLEECLK